MPKRRNILYRQGCNYENLNKYIFNGEGAYGIPKLFPENHIADDFIGFNYAKSCKAPQDKGIHFFIDDYQFSRLWNCPDRYIDLLGKFDCVCTPDFSTYADFPAAIQIYNHYRKHWLGAYWQMHGISVIPTISWSDEESFKWCFDGEPVDGTVAVSSVGIFSNKENKVTFLRGYNEMLVRLKPERIIFYGNVPEECTGNIVRIAAFQESMKMRCKEKERVV